MRDIDSVEANVWGRSVMVTRINVAGLSDKLLAVALAGIISQCNNMLRGGQWPLSTQGVISEIRLETSSLLN